MAIDVGKKAPAFRLSDAEGRVHTLQDYAGEDLVLYFYPRADTPGCTKEACGFRDLWKKLRSRGVAVVGVSPDGTAALEKFAAKYRLPFPLLGDPDKKVMQRYGAWGEKTLYGKKTVGVIRSTVWIGPDGRVKRHWARIPSAAEHPQRVLEALDAED